MQSRLLKLLLSLALGGLLLMASVIIDGAQEATAPPCCTGLLADAAH
jgi:hypothetical protein